MNQEFEDVYRLLAGVIPEREQEIAALLDRYAIGFRRGPDTGGFKMANGYGQVMYNDRTMIQMYLVSFMAWRTLQAYSGLILLYDFCRKPFDLSTVSAESGQAAADAATDRLARILRNIHDAWGIADVPWPTDVPTPTLGRHQNPEDQAAQEIALLATAYVLLHEIHHVVLGDKAPGGWKEEMLCDEFARSFMLSGVNEYAQPKGISPPRVLNKRAMGVALANGVYAEITPPALWSGSGHPPVADRFRANYVGWPADEYAPVWIYMACLLAARLRREGRTVGAVAFQTPRALCMSLTDLVR